MRELITSAALVLAVAILGFVALDTVGEPGAPVRVDAALAAAQHSVVAGAGTGVELPLHLLLTPDQRLSINYDPQRWYRLEYSELATLEHQRVAGCQLELESNGEPVRATGEWTQMSRVLGEHRYSVGMVTPAGDVIPRQVMYSALDGNAYLVFTLRVGSTVTSEADYATCRADAEAILATLHRTGAE